MYSEAISAYSPKFLYNKFNIITQGISVLFSPLFIFLQLCSMVFRRKEGLYLKIYAMRNPMNDELTSERYQRQPFKDS